jgi:hypothetical protein
MPLRATIHLAALRGSRSDDLYRRFLAKVQDESIGAHVPDVVSKLSPWSVADTVTRLFAVAAAREPKVFTVIDHSGEAANVGLHLRDTKLVILGSPAAGTPVMEAAPLAALDLPLKGPHMGRRVSNETQLHSAGRLGRSGGRYTDGTAEQCSRGHPTKNHTYSRFRVIDDIAMTLKMRI